MAKIDGNLFTRLQLQNVLLQAEQDTLFLIPAIDVKYSPLRFLRDEIFIRSFTIDSAYINLSQNREGRWNFSQIIKGDSTKTPDSTRPVKPFPFKIFLNNFSLNGARIKITAKDSAFPKLINNFSTRLSAFYSHNSQQLNLKSIRFVSRQPNLELRQLSFSLSRNRNGVSLTNFVLRTAKNDFNAQGEYTETAEPNASLSLQSGPLELNELRFVLPDIHFGNKPSVNLMAGLSNDSLLINLEISENNQKILLKAQAAPFSNFFNNSRKQQIHYNIRGELMKVDLAQWLTRPAPDLKISGVFEVKGVGVEPRKSHISVNANFRDCLIYRRAVSQVRFKSDYRDGGISARINLSGGFGDLGLEMAVKDLFGKQNFEVETIAREINVAELFLEDSLQSNINFDLKTTGSGLDPTTVKSELKCSLGSSTFMDYQIDTLFTVANISGTDFQIDTLCLNSSLASLYLEGKVSLNSENNFKFQLHAGELMKLKRFITADTLHASGDIYGTISGTFDSLMANVDIQLQNVLYNSYAMDTLIGEASVLFGEDQTGGKANFNIHRADIGPVVADSLRIQSDFSGKIINFESDIFLSDSISAYLQTQIVADTVLEITIRKINFDLKDRKFFGGGDETKILFSDGDFRIGDFRISSADSQTYFSAGGALSLNSRENLQVDLSGFDIGWLNSVLKIPLELDGILSLKTTLGGTAGEPLLKGNFSVLNGHINNAVFHSIDSKFNYSSKRFSWNFVLRPRLTDSLKLYGYLPVNLSFTDRDSFLLMNRQMNVQIVAKSIPLGMLVSGYEAAQGVQGVINCDLSLKNTPADPRPAGMLKIQDGAFKIPSLGIDYSDLQLLLSAESNRIRLDSLSIKNRDGYLKASGFLNLGNDILSGEFTSNEFKLTASDFYITKHKDFKIEIAADAELTGNPQSPKFGGNITIIQSSFYLPRVMEMTGSKAVREDLAVPVLVEAISESQGEKELVEAETKKTPTPSLLKESAFFKNLRGSLKLAIPGNTWVKNPSMRMEIGGDLELVKKDKGVEIFGTINIIRGNYDLFGRQFKVEEGQLNFRGGKEINPQVVLEAEYSFRTTSREMRVLKLNLIGELTNPSLNFTIDGKEISDTDALSYVLFGKSQDELTYSQQFEVTGSSEQNKLAMDVASSLVSSQLTRTLGRNLSVDYIELKAKDNWQTATFVVGKYITSDLFLSYQREFGEGNDDDVAPETITVEYEVTRQIFLQVMEGDAKTRGFDVIFKIEK